MVAERLKGVFEKSNWIIAWRFSMSICQSALGKLLLQGLHVNLIKIQLAF